MKARIDDKGNIKIIAETEQEAHELEQWFEKHKEVFGVILPEIKVENRGVKNMYEIVVIQESENSYSWALIQRAPYRVIATSRLIAEKYLVKNEAYEIANKFGLSVFFEER